MNKQKKLKLCLAASAGGHMSQLLKVCESWEGHETFCVTTVDVAREQLEEYGHVYVVGECNREQPVQIMVVLMRCIKVILCERPDVVISTGAAPACMLCFLAKIMGASIIWIDSITNVEKISLSGRLTRHIANLFLVQWPGLAEKFSNVEYVGTVI